MNARSSLILFLLLLPLLGLGGLLLSHELTLSKATPCRLDITGHDPRHLLYGPYLRFDFLPLQKTPEAQSCLERIDAIPPFSYYLNEEDAALAEELLMDPENHAAMDVKITRSGRVLLRQLYINDQPF